MSNQRICTFFGHRELERDISIDLEAAIRQMIEKQGITVFWSGGYGAFDSKAAFMVHKLKKEYPHITIILILAYLPKSKDRISEIYDDSIYPEGLEIVPKRFAISKRNRWMAEQCDAVIAYVNHTYGGAWQAYQLAQKQQKKCRNLGTLDMCASSGKSGV